MKMLGKMILVSGNYRSSWTGENNQKIRIAKKYLRFALFPNLPHIAHRFDLTVQPIPSTWDWGTERVCMVSFGAQLVIFLKNGTHF